LWVSRESLPGRCKHIWPGRMLCVAPFHLKHCRYFPGQVRVGKRNTLPRLRSGRPSPVAAGFARPARLRRGMVPGWFAARGQCLHLASWLRGELVITHRLFPTQKKELSAACHTQLFLLGGETNPTQTEKPKRVLLTLTVYSTIRREIEKT
jgi:hypothetical protein